MDDGQIRARIDQMNKCLIRHPVIQTAINGIEAAVRFSNGTQEPVNVLLTGEAGTGKTTACHAILKNRPRSLERREDAEYELVPAFYALVPSPITIRSVASSMLRSLGDPAPNRGTAVDLTHRLGTLLEQCRTEVILLDELQHLLKQDMGKSDNVKDWLKTIINQFKVPIIAVGMPKCAEIINQDAQLARRFPRHYRLSDLSFGGSNKGSYRRFVESLSKAYLKFVDLQDIPNFRAKHYAMQMYVATGGNPGHTTTLFREASVTALLDGREEVSFEDFTRAYSQLTLPNGLSFDVNPFEMGERALTKTLNSCSLRAA